MSVLDELRKKAAEKKAIEQQNELLEGQLDKVYQTDLLPKMQLIFDTLKETVSHLNFLEEPIKVTNYSTQYPQFGSLLQSSYKINTDGRIGLADYDHLMEVNLSFLLEAKGSFSYPIENKSLIEKEVSFLQTRRVNFTWKYLDSKNGIAVASFTVQRSIPVSFRVAVDYPKSQLDVAIRNHENFESFNKSFSPNELNDDFLDKFLSYFLRKDNRLLEKDEISEEYTSAIKTAIHKNFATYQQKIEQTALLENKKFEGEQIPPENLLIKKASPIKSILSKFQKKD